MLLLARAPRALGGLRQLLGLGLERRRALDDRLARLGADQPLLDREHRAPRGPRALVLRRAQEPRLDRPLGHAQRLEHAVRRVLEDVGEHAVTVEHAQELLAVFSARRVFQIVRKVCQTVRLIAPLPGIPREFGMSPSATDIVLQQNVGLWGL